MTVNIDETTAEETSEHEDQSMDEMSVETYDFYIETIVSHQTNRDKRHPNANFVETLDHIRWIGYDSRDSLPNLTRSHVITNHENTACHCRKISTYPLTTRFTGQQTRVTQKVTI